MGVARCVCITLAVLLQVNADSYNIVAVVDHNSPQYDRYLSTAVNHIKTTFPDVNLEIIHSSENDSFGAMEQVCTSLRGGVSVVLDMSTRYVTATVRSLCEAMGVAHVSAVDPSYQSEKRIHNVSLNFHPPASTMIQAVRTIVDKENLTNVAIIYDSTFDLDNKPKRLLANLPTQHLYLRMALTSSAISDQLEKIKSAELTHLFLLSSAANADVYLGKANSKNLMNFKYRWFLMTKDPAFTCTGCKEESVIVEMTGYMHYLPRQTYLEAQKAMDPTYNINDIQMDSSFVYDMVQMVGTSIHKLATSGGAWRQHNYTDCFSFTATDPTAYNDAISLKQEIQKSTQAGVFGDYTFTGNTARQDIVVTIQRNVVKLGSSVSEETIGNWTLNKGLYAVKGTIADKRVKKHYRVVTVEERPFIFKVGNKGTNADYDGYCIELLRNIAEKLDFNYTIYESPDGKFGSMQPNGSWDGMVNELVQGRADIIVAPLSVMAERENVIDFTVPYYDLVGITILMRKPVFKYELFKFMNVLEEKVWGCVFSAFIIVSILLSLFDKYSPYSYQNNKKTWDGKGDEPRVFTLKEGLWFCMTSLTPQGGGEAPRALSGRLVAATWWMFGFIMIATYTANLAAFLTVSRLDTPIESLDDLAKQFKTKYAPQSSTATQVYFRRMKEIEEKFYGIWKGMSLNDSLDQVERAKLAVWDYPVSDKFTNMWVSMEQSKFPETFEEAIYRVKNEDFAFIGDATQNKYSTLTDCDLWEVGEEFSRKPYALAVQEGSPLKNELSSVILQLLNQRVLEELKTKWWDYKKVDCPKIEDESDGISIQNIGGVFLVIFIGIGLGLLTLAFEYLYYRWWPNRNRPRATNISVKEAHARVNGGFEPN